VENRLRLEGRSLEGDDVFDVGVEDPGEEEATARCINLKRINFSENHGDCGVVLTFMVRTLEERVRDVPDGVLLGLPFGVAGAMLDRLIS